MSLSTPAGALSQWRTMVAQGIHMDWNRKERVLSPLLFAATVLIMFSLALGEVEPDLVPKLFLGQLFLTCLFSIQLALGRTFELDQKDAVFQLLRSYPVSRGAWFFSKWTLVFIQSLVIIIPTAIIAAAFNQSANYDLLEWEIIGLLALAVCALCSVGVVLAGITLQSEGRDVLFPILYFPLCVPVLIAAVQAGNSFYYDPAEMSTLQQWTLLLGGFTVIYTTLGYLLFSELVD